MHYKDIKNIKNVVSHEDRVYTEVEFNSELTARIFKTSSQEIY